jgi:hypothetical protein
LSPDIVSVQKSKAFVLPSSLRLTLIVTPFAFVQTRTVSDGVSTHCEPSKCPNPYVLSDWSTTKTYSAPSASA